MSIENENDLRGLLKIGRIVGEALQAMRESVQVGLNTAQLDSVGAAYLLNHGARSAPMITYDFPGYSCISINDEAAHGIPGERIIQAGDLVKIDLSAELDGYYADACITVGVGELSPTARHLLACAEAALAEGIKAAQAGQALNSIGRAVEGEVRKRGFHVLDQLPGHGVGRGLHEEPSVPMIYRRGVKRPLKAGMVFTIEPHIAAKRGRIYEAADGWTLKTHNQSWVAAFEHTVVITPQQAILTTAL